MELSIVLVIIGLLVGGILAGADLIRAAKMGKVISEQEQIKTAVNAFYLKYNCIPGDCYNISTYLSGETNGDGDETMDNAAAANGAGEGYAAWKHLAAAGLYPGSYTGLAGPNGVAHSVVGTNVPASKAVSKAGYTFLYIPTQTGSVWYWNGVPYGNLFIFGKEISNDYTYGGAFKPVDAYNIDKKLDDGIPGTGKVRTYRSIGYCETSGSSLNAPASSAYYITYDSTTCNLMFLLE